MIEVYDGSFGTLKINGSCNSQHVTEKCRSCGIFLHSSDPMAFPCQNQCLRIVPLGHARVIEALRRDLVLHIAHMDLVLGPFYYSEWLFVNRESPYS